MYAYSVSKKKSSDAAWSVGFMAPITSIHGQGSSPYGHLALHLVSRARLLSGLP